MSMIQREEYVVQAAEAASFLAESGMMPVDVVLQTGSGMSWLADDLLPGGQRVEMERIPHFPSIAVPGHGKEAVYGDVGGLKLLVFCGRPHLYEGHTPLEAGFPSAVAKACGAQLMLLLSTAGAVNQLYRAGDLMVATSFINFQGDDALRYLKTVYEERFLDPRRPFHSRVSQSLSMHLQQTDLSIRHGIYLGVHGPMYETLAELHMMRNFGADVIGKSVIPETTVARVLDLPIVCVCLVTNESFRPERVTHQLVLRLASMVNPGLAKGFRSFLEDEDWRGKLAWPDDEQVGV